MAVFCIFMVICFHSRLILADFLSRESSLDLTIQKIWILIEKHSHHKCWNVGNQSRWLEESMETIVFSVKQVVFLSFCAEDAQFFVDFLEIQLKCQAVFIDDSPFFSVSTVVEGGKRGGFYF